MQWGTKHNALLGGRGCGAGGADRAAVVDAMEGGEGAAISLMAIDDPRLAAKCAGRIAPCVRTSAGRFDRSVSRHRRRLTGSKAVTGAPACTVAGGWAWPPRPRS